MPNCWWGVNDTENNFKDVKNVFITAKSECVNEIGCFLNRVYPWALLTEERWHVLELISYQQTSKETSPTEHEETTDECDETVIHSHFSLFQLVSFSRNKSPLPLSDVWGATAPLPPPLLPGNPIKVSSVQSACAARRAEPQCKSGCTRRFLIPINPNPDRSVHMVHTLDRFKCVCLIEREADREVEADREEGESVAGS